MTIIDSSTAWDEFVQSIPDVHLLQTSAWGQFKSAFGWSVYHIQQGQCGAQVLFRKLPLGFSIAYIPKGPVGKGWKNLWGELDKVCRQKRAIMLIVEPDLWEPVTLDVRQYFQDGFTEEEHTIQPRRSIVIDLSGDEESILAQMKQKTRYNIRLAEKKNVSVEETSDINGFYGMMQTTGNRDGFALHEAGYYRQVYDLFAPSGQCALLQASFEGKPLAALMVFANQKRAWYFYGASTDVERNRMPTYLLQWEAMRWAKAKGCTSYDLWGVPDTDEEKLEAQFPERSDGLWGVYRFKRGFGGKLVRSAPAFVRVYRPLMYKLIALRVRGQVAQA